MSILREPALRPHYQGCWSVCQATAGKTALHIWLQSAHVISPSFFLIAWHLLGKQNTTNDNLGVRFYVAEQRGLHLALLL